VIPSSIGRREANKAPADSRWGLLHARYEARAAIAAPQCALRVQHERCNALFMALPGLKARHRSAAPSTNFRGDRMR
jgi:hypothetical protein